MAHALWMRLPPGGRTAATRQMRPMNERTNEQTDRQTDGQHQCVKPRFAAEFNRGESTTKCDVNAQFQ